VALGGTLWEDIRAEMPNALDHDHYRVGVERNLLPHAIDVMPGSRLNQLLGTEHTRVNSLHHQGVRRIAGDLRATATAPDGLVEALELPTHRFALSVQWHPENLVGDDPAMLNLFRGLVEAV
jgi:putative glutamine amidotransferase